MFCVVKGDLFSEKQHPLCHCISEDYEMSLGIAVKFRILFGRPKEKVKVGEIVPTISPSGQTALNLVTKKKYWGKPKFDDLKSCLEKVAKFCCEHNIQAISMPRIGCGLDKLDWVSQVEPAIRTILKDVDVTVYTL